MTLVSNDPSWWPIINSNRFFSYWIVASTAAAIYDSVLTFGQEVELVWRRRWSLISILYLSLRYAAIPYTVVYILPNILSVEVTDSGCYSIYSAINGSNLVIAAILGVIMIARLHAMYQGSRKMLIFLIAIFLAVNISCGVVSGIALKNLSGEELILDGTYECTFYYEGGVQILVRMDWILSTVWEVLVLCLAVWIAMKHFRDLRRLGPSTGSTLGDCFTVLIESHALYFASFAVVACLELGSLSPKITAENSMGALMYSSLLEIVEILQMFVLGPRLILSVRKYHAKLVANSDAGTGMTSIAFQEREHVSAGSDV